MDEPNVKILFRFFSDVLDEWTVETIWANVVDIENGLYKLDNIPFYASVACDDIVFAEFDEDEQMLTYRETIEHSGNSTVQIVLLDKTIEINSLRERFKAMGCDSEKFHDSYFVMEIPAELDYFTIRKELNNLESQNIISYGEPCLAKNHWY